MSGTRVASGLEAALAAAQAEQRRAGERVAAGAAPAAIERTAAILRERFAVALPAASARFLAIRNGLDCDGLALYHADAGTDAGGEAAGLVEANRLWRGGPAGAGLLVLGDGDMDLYVVGPDGTRPTARDRASGDIVETFGDVETMLTVLIRRRLGG